MKILFSLALALLLLLCSVRDTSRLPTKESWTAAGALTPIKGEVNWITFRNENEGWIGAENNGSEPHSLYRTVDGGRTWQEQYLVSPNRYQYANARSLSFSEGDRLNGVLEIDYSNRGNTYTYTYLSDDGGLNWRVDRIAITVPDSRHSAFSMNIIKEPSNLSATILLNDTSTKQVHAELRFYDANYEKTGSIRIDRKFQPGELQIGNLNQEFPVEGNVLSFEFVELAVSEIQDWSEYIAKTLYMASNHRGKLNDILNTVSVAEMYDILKAVIHQSFLHEIGAEEKVVQAILQRLPNFNEKEQEFGNALLIHDALLTGGAMKLLIEHGADIQAKNAEGISPLIAVSSKNNPDLVAHLLKHGADPQAKMNDGTTALIAAIRPMFSSYTNETVETVRLLLVAEADVHATLPDGTSMVRYLKNHLNGEAVNQIIALLEKQGAK